ncbi:uncharacterized protein P7C70_g4629, partial [Phenoliferia sp. Uapishka_3]
MLDRLLTSLDELLRPYLPAPGSPSLPINVLYLGLLPLSLLLFSPPIKSMFRSTFYSTLSALRLTSRPHLVMNDKPAVLSRIDRETGKEVRTSLREVVERCRSLGEWYTPTFWLASGHLATIYCTIADFSYDSCTYSRRLLQLPDGGSISLDFTPPITPEDPIDSRPILVALHGLTGGSHESYVIDVLSKITKERDEKNLEGQGLGWRAVVVNFRGGAYTDDLRCALSYLSHLAPKAPLYGVGFSLGANVLAKYLGEEGDKTPLKAGVVLGAPWDFYAGHVYLSRSWLSTIYSKAMAKNLRGVVSRNRAALEGAVDFDCMYGNPQQTLYEFDSVGTRVIAGYTSVEAYYKDASANQHAHNISVPTLSLSSSDDPIIPASSVPFSAALANPNLIIGTTLHGGHLGWFTGFFRPRRWISRPVIEFLREMERADPVARKHLETVPQQREGKVPSIGDDMVVVRGGEDVGFRETAVGVVESGGSVEDAGLTRGL